MDNLNNLDNLDNHDNYDNYRNHENNDENNFTTEAIVAVPSENTGDAAIIQPPIQESIEEKAVKPKKRRAAPILALMLAVALIGSGSGFLTVYLTEALHNPRSASSGYNGPRLPDSTTAVSSDSNADNPSFLINDTLAESGSDKYAYDELYEAVKEAVVAIKVSYSYRFGREYVTESNVVGSGVMFTTDGYVLTNHHVIEDVEAIWVVVTEDDNDPDSSVEYEAEVIGSDKESDIAVLKISGEKPFSVVPIGDSSTLKVGQEISAIGYPLGLERTMTTGVVSGLNRIVYPTGGYELSSIQVTAAVNPGNSGGPLFDMYGNVVGIVNKKLVFESIENIGFAITINEAKPIINDLMEYGKITSRPLLGITGQELNAQIAEMYGFTGVESGVLVQGITQTAPVARSGLAVGDIIIKIDKHEIKGITDIQSATKNLKAGDTVEVTVLRFDQFKNRVEETVTVELTVSPDLG